MAGSNRTAKSKRSGRRKHSFGGCRTCRRRHVKCDQIRPSCLACRAVNAVCEGYASDVRWLSPATLASAGEAQLEHEQTGQKTTRHHLYSEASRASMSIALVRELGSNTVDESLAEIEERTKDPQSLGGSQFGIGSFGVFSVSARPREVAVRSLPAVEQLAPQHVNLSSGFVDMGVSDESFVDPSTAIDDIALQDAPSIPSVVDWFDPILGFNNTLHWADLFGLDFDESNSLINPNPLPWITDFSLGEAPPDRTPDVFSRPGGLSSQSQPSYQTDQPPPYASNPPSFEQASPTIFSGEHPSLVLAEVKTVAEAQFLLKHFHRYVIHHMSFMPSNKKSPWTTMQLAEAMRALSELTYMNSGTLKHANAANLYGLMACSAYHLAVSSSIQSGESQEYWAQLFDRLKERAKAHMKISLREELKGSSKAKYKDQLMAILSLLALTSISGSQHDARAYMIDAERLLRVKGLAKREISRKCRLLHHVYTWVRIVGESTYVIHDYQVYGPVVDNMSAAHRAGRLHGNREKRGRDAQARDEHNARLDDFLRLEPHSSDSDLDIDEIKEREGGLHDIHLEDSRQYHETLYNVYGVSETWLSLVSQVTRLANILDATRYAKATDVSFHDFLQKRAGRLENIICSFALKDPASDDEAEPDQSMDPRPLNHHMLRAMNSALVILFYRRIRNVNPLILQGHVDSVVQSLREFDIAIASQGIEGPGSAWPAFIAGCEALSRRNRTYLVGWLENGFKKCGLEYFGASRQLMKEVWERQDEPTPLLDPGSGNSNQSRPQKSASCHRTWVDISREKNAWVILF